MPYFDRVSEVRTVLDYLFRSFRLFCLLFHTFSFQGLSNILTYLTYLDCVSWVPVSVLPQFELSPSYTRQCLFTTCCIRDGGNSPDSVSSDTGVRCSSCGFILLLLPSPFLLQHIDLLTYRGLNLILINKEFVYY